MNSTLKNTVQS